MRWRIRASGSRSIHSWKQEAAIWWARSASREGAKEWTVTVLRDQVAIVSKIDALGSAISKFQNGVAGFVLALIVAAMAAIVSLRQRIQGSS